MEPVSSVQVEPELFQMALPQRDFTDFVKLRDRE